MTQQGGSFGSQFKPEQTLTEQVTEGATTAVKKTVEVASEALDQFVQMPWSARAVPSLEMVFQDFTFGLSFPLRHRAQRRFCRSDSRARPAALVGPVETPP